MSDDYKKLAAETIYTFIEKFREKQQS